MITIEYFDKDYKIRTVVVQDNGKKKRLPFEQRLPFFISDRRFLRVRKYKLEGEGWRVPA